MLDDGPSRCSPVLGTSQDVHESGPADAGYHAPAGAPPRRLLGPATHYKLWLPLASIFLFFGSSELLCRMTNSAQSLEPNFAFYVRSRENDVELPYVVEDPRLMWALRAGFEGSENLIWGRTSVEINSEGLRDREYDVEKPENVFRLLCLGDSCTFGLGVQAEQTYHGLLEAQLNGSRQQDGRRYEILNGGVTGYTSEQCLVLYRHKGYQYRPDVVTVMAGGNDFLEKFFCSDRKMLARLRPRGVRLDGALAHLHCYRTLRGLARATSQQTWPDKPSVPRCNIDEYMRNISELNESCAAAGSRLVLISPTYSSQVAFWAGSQGDVSQQVPRYRRALEDVAAAHRIPLLEVPEMTERASAGNQHLFLDKFHPSVEGHALLAARLQEFLEQHGLLGE